MTNPQQQPRMTLPVFPLGETALLPCTLLPLHIFEPRYRQMVDVCRRTDGRFIMATVERDESTCRLRQAGCCARIVSVDTLADGRSNILVHGVERVRITAVIEPDGERLYHMVRAEPLEPADDAPESTTARRRFVKLLKANRLRELNVISLLRSHADQAGTPLRALIDMAGAALLQGHEQRYRFLAEACADRRRRLAEEELRALDRLIRHAELICPGSDAEGPHLN